MSDWLGLAGQTAAVTGGGSGIGKAVATELARVGCAVAVLDKNLAAAEAVAAELVAAGHKAQAFEIDTSQKAVVEACAANVVEALGAPTVLVNNAGILKPGPLETIDVEEWDALLKVNLTGYLLVSQAFFPGMKAAGTGSIVHIASIAATNPQVRSGAYSPSKAAVAMLSRQLSVEWGPYSIRSNVVAPGLIRTALSEAFYQAPGVLEARTNLVPIKRVGGPQDIADVVVFLASKRSGYCSGSHVVVDGGLDGMLMDLVPRPGY